MFLQKLSLAECSIILWASWALKISMHQLEGECGIIEGVVEGISSDLLFTKLVEVLHCIKI